MKIRIRKYHKGDLAICAKLTRETYKECCFFDGPPEASKAYIDMYDIDKNFDFTREMMETSKIFFVALIDDEIVGLIRGGKERVRGLYVNSRHHRKGIGKRLLEKFEEVAYEEGSREIKIRASLYAVPFYQKQGYKKTTGIRLMEEVKIQPMKKVLL
jgi:GNAT superfamily N-acetyltransferase